MCAMLESFGAEEKLIIWQFRKSVTCFPASVARIDLQRAGPSDPDTDKMDDGKTSQQSSLNVILKKKLKCDIKK